MFDFDLVFTLNFEFRSSAKNVCRTIFWFIFVFDPCDWFDITNHSNACMFIAKSTFALQRERFHTLGQPHGHVRSRLGATRRTAVFVGWTVSKQFVSILLLSSMHVFASLRVCRRHAARSARHCRRRCWHHDFVSKQFFRLQFDNYSTKHVPLLRLWRSRSGAGRIDAPINFAQWRFHGALRHVFLSVHCDVLCTFV